MCRKTCIVNVEKVQRWLIAVAVSASAGARRAMLVSFGMLSATRIRVHG